MKLMNSVLILVLLVGFLIPAALAAELPNASFTVNRTGLLGQVSQTVLFTNTSTVAQSITAYNLSLQGTGNNTIWYNGTSLVTPYAYTYSLAGNFTPYLIVKYSSGTNTSVVAYVNVTYLVPPSFTCSQPSGSTNLNGTRPFTVYCNDTSPVPVSTWDWYGDCLSTNVTTKNISMTCYFGGYKTVSLIIGNGNGTNTSPSSSHYIWVKKGWLDFLWGF